MTPRKLRDMFGITPTEFADKHFGKYNERDDEIELIKCPYCKGGKSNDKKTAYINKETGAFVCHRAKCGKKKSFKEILVDFGEIDENFTVSTGEQPHGVGRLSTKKKDYDEPDLSSVETNLSDEVLDWFDWRSISEKTVDYWNIMEESHNRGDKFDHHIAFPYYEDGEVVLMKYRVPNRTKEDKQIWQAGGGKPVLWGTDNLDYDKPLTITEGELDAMALTEAGIDNVTSVPFGTNNLQWIEESWETIDKFDEIILWMDKDDPGQKATKKIVKRLGKWRCKVVDYDEHKDANKTLVAEGEGAVRSAIENAVELNISGLHHMTDIEDWDPSDQDKVLSSIDAVNDKMQGYFLPSVTIITGLSGSGKSTFVDQEAVHAMSQGYKTLVYSGELKPPLLRYWMERQMATPKIIARKEDEDTGSTNYYVPKVHKQRMRAWYKDDLFIYDTEYGTEGEEIDYKDRLVTAEKLLEVFEYSVKKYGIEVFVVDNLMTIDFNLGLDSKWDEQTRFLAMLKNFANEYDVAVLLVAHPRKNEGKITIKDIAGRMNIVNYVDSILSVARIDNKSNDDLPDFLHDKDSSITFLKDRLYGTQHWTEGLNFNKATKRFYDTEHNLKTVYGWTGIDFE